MSVPATFKPGDPALRVVLGIVRALGAAVMSWPAMVVMIWVGAAGGSVDVPAYDEESG